MPMSSLEWYEVELALRRLKETSDKAADTPRSWGGDLEALYEKYYSLLNKVIDEGWGCKDKEKKKECIEKERLYTGIRNALLRKYPHLLVWAKANQIHLSN